jgi:hypothetical protein
MKLQLAIKLDNAAFEDDNRGPEIARILRKLADSIERDNGATGMAGLYDIDDNRVGAVEIG